ASNKLKRGQRIKVSAPYKEKTEKVTAQSSDKAKEKSESGSEAKEATAPAPEKKTTPAPKPAKNYSIYKVRRGDSLWKIAASHGMTLDEIRKLNGCSSSTKIKVGQQIKVKKK
ncbi:MAG: LysM peptidoglycan-binding domain-containing protein, partial [Bacteroidia bacterium]